MGQLSGGEKVRLELCRIFYTKPNFLILDEPTNHMDLAGKEALEKMLTSYEGTVLFVSHDRYFINQVATGILEFGESDVQFYEMNYAQYLEEIKRQTPGRETGNAGGAGTFSDLSGNYWEDAILKLHQPFVICGKFRVHHFQLKF